MTCAECHVMPSEVASPGHIDTPPPVEVFPRGFGGLAEARGAEPRWEQGTCSNVYCHGGQTLDWGGAPEAVYCGTCHAIPPEDAAHVAGLRFTDCAGCHASSVDEFGNPMIDAEGRSAHLDGDVDR
jgi:predicted CxxxxCH...CXXCH cytochrome family protein